MDDCKCNRNEIGMLIKQISFQLRTHADMDLRKCDLTWSQAHLLRHLAKTEGQMSQKQIEKELENAGFSKIEVDQNQKIR